MKVLQTELKLSDVQVLSAYFSAHKLRFDMPPSVSSTRTTNDIQDHLVCDSRDLSLYGRNSFEDPAPRPNPETTTDVKEY